MCHTFLERGIRKNRAATILQHNKQVYMQKKELGSTPKRLSFKIQEAAELIGVSQASIRRAIQRGLLKPCRAFRHPLIPAEQLQKLVAGR